MSAIREEVLAANAAYAKDFGDKGRLAMPPARHFAILTCMDARLDPAKYAGLREGDAHVILHGDLHRQRHARAVREEPRHGRDRRRRLARRREGTGSTEAEYIDWLTIDDQEQSVLRDVRRLRAHPLVPSSIPIRGYVYDVKSGRLVEVAEATRAGGAPA
jgi:carbonic anhydrase